MEAYNFFVEFVFLTLTVVFTTMVLSYGIVNEFKAVTMYNLLTNSIIGSVIVYYMVYYIFEPQLQFFIMMIMCIFLFKASSDLSVAKSIKTVLLSLLLNIIIQVIIAFLMMLIFNVTLQEIQNSRTYSIIGTLTTSTILSLLGFKLYLIKLKEVKKWFQKLKQYL